MIPDIILADDFTGAGDSGIHFAQSGKRTALLLDRSALAQVVAGHDAVSVSTESRFLPPAQAAQAVHAAALACVNAGARICFKKIDSTLRGNPGAEIEAILAATCRQAALVCVAMPKTGRICIDGTLLLHGVPLAETETGRDPFNPVPCSSIAGIVASQTSLPAVTIPLSTIRSGLPALMQAIQDAMAAGARLLIADGETDADIAMLGAALRQLPQVLPVGAGGLAEAVTEKTENHCPRFSGRILAVIGSLSSIAAAQIEHAETSGLFSCMELDIAKVLENPEWEIARLESCLQDIPADRHVILKNKTAPQHTGGMDTAVAEQAAGIFGKAAAKLCQTGQFPVLYATGGSTAEAIAKALGLGSITLQYEYMPGVVVSSCSAPGLPLHWFITKAGAFGGPDTLTRLVSTRDNEKRTS